ncbi:PSD1 and planctomycete cytochrome C domain-containing protein [Novipirellula sp. SH528]|uniref:PSD1 and planctomycete cytochrome C domain-containing protein n=1 Tax=Novipirellula sp. SH528 TaxID=3454466 RepID=UPI003FA0EE1C
MQMLAFTTRLIVVSWVFLVATIVGHTAEPTADQLEFFEKEVRPLLAEHCYSCHSASAKKLQAGLRVDTRAGMIAGGDSGASIEPGDPEASLFMEAVRYESYEMPPKGKLNDDQIATFEKWIQLGAPWPAEETPEAKAETPEFDLQQRENEHWVWQPVQSPAPPTVQDASWPRAELDRFILSKLEENNLHPAEDADHAAILRRLYFDLIGLPPTPEQTAKFLSDTSPEALERCVDELLESPQFGERWGRHWLDLVRYAESRGHEFDDDALNAFQFRDYIIRAFNADVPYDQLVREHIAGDLLPQPRLNPETGYNESVLGTGFWFLGEWVHSPVDIRKDEADRFDNMVDVMSKTFLGMTVSCARCHDHKFDAISTADYYSLTGFLQSSDYRQVRFESLQQNRHVAEQLAKVDASYRLRVTDLIRQHGGKLPEAAAIPSAISDLLVFDYQTLPYDQFMQDGFIFGDRPRHAGDAYLDASEAQPAIRFASHGSAISDPLWNGLQSLRESGMQSRSKLTSLPRSGRTLRTPTFELTGERVLCRVRGEGHVVVCVDSHRLIAGPLHGETVQKIPPNATSLELNLSRYLGHRLHLEFTPARDKQLEVQWVIQGTNEQIKQAKSEGKSAFGDAGMTDGLEASDVGAKEEFAEAAQQLAVAWADERELLRSQIMKQSYTAMAMMDGSGEDAEILIRGNSSKPGDIEPRHFLTAVAGEGPMEIKSGSGRLELAAQINDPSNPLTSRVIVNRIWHHLMGRGIVPTTDDFGVLGQRPTHPELLDHLATRFRTDGQSIKEMIRYIALSRTYQMSSRVSPAAEDADPKNLLWHHRPPKRLEGETIRDSLLALSGRLDKTMFGEPVPIQLTSFMDGRGRPKTSGPLDGNGRRSIYISVRRNFLSPFMLTFDTPVPFSTMGRRNVSNVPAQSLILMNDPFVVQQSKQWAERVIQDHPATRDRIKRMYDEAFARQPTTQEIAVAEAYLASDHGDSELDAWADFAHALINTKEFVFLR